MREADPNGPGQLGESGRGRLLYRADGDRELIEASTSTEDAYHSKPSPEIFEAALLKLGRSKRQTLVVGDTPWDILAAHRCALPIAAVRSGGFKRSTLTKAEFIFSSVHTLVERIEQIDDYFNG